VLTADSEIVLLVLSDVHMNVEDHLIEEEVVIEIDS